MKKLISFLIIGIFLLSFTSAWYNYDDRYKQVTTFDKKTEERRDFKNGYEKITTSFSQRTEIERKSTGPNHYSFSHSNWNYPASNWRYSYPNYDTSKYNYYYKPRYDYNLGYYNWRY